jgi:hypothetical protein
MAHHHKSNRAVEGGLDDGHGRGMPRRPDVEVLARRAEDDRREAGLPVREQEDAERQYDEAAAAIDRQVTRGEMATDRTRRELGQSFPPTRYER